MRQSTIACTDILDATKGLALLDESKDGAGIPIEVLPLTGEKAGFNRVHNGKNCVEPCGARWILAPGAVAADSKRNRLLVFYRKILRRASPKSDRVGTSLAV